MIRGLPDKRRLIRFLQAEGWIIHPTLDRLSTLASNKMPPAPLCFEPEWLLAHFRQQMKLIDALPETLEDKYVGVVTALKIWKWILQKKAMGKNEAQIQEVVFEAVDSVDEISIFELKRRLSEIDTSGEDLGKMNFNNTRIDRGNPKTYRNDPGCLAPDRYKVLRAEREKRVISKLKGHDGGYYRQNENTGSGYHRSNENTNSTNSNGKKWQSSFSTAKGKSKAPKLDRFFKAKFHLPKGSDGGIEFCQAWQTDSCLLPSGQKCDKYHRCENCSGRHPGKYCLNVV